MFFSLNQKKEGFFTHGGIKISIWMCWRSYYPPCNWAASWQCSHRQKVAEKWSWQLPEGSSCFFRCSPPLLWVCSYELLNFFLPFFLPSCLSFFLFFSGTRPHFSFVADEIDELCHSFYINIWDLSLFSFCIFYFVFLNLGFFILFILYSHLPSPTLWNHQLVLYISEPISVLFCLFIYFVFDPTYK